MRELPVFATEAESAKRITIAAGRPIAKVKYRGRARARTLANTHRYGKPWTQRSLSPPVAKLNGPGARSSVTGTYCSHLARILALSADPGGPTDKNRLNLLVNLKGSPGLEPGMEVLQL
jgi:hypothetical protein